MSWLSYLIIISIIAGTGFLFSSDKTEDTNSSVLIPSTEQKNGGTATFFNSTVENGSYTPIDEISDINSEEIEEKRSQTEDLQSRAEDLNWEIDRMRRNADSYDADEFSSKLKRLQWEAEDLSSEVGDVGVDDAASSLDDASYKLRRLRSDVEDEPRYFYGEREDEIDSRLRRSSWDTDDASSYFDDFASSLDDY